MSPRPAARGLPAAPPPGTKQKLDELGRREVRRAGCWREKRVLITDTSMRDAHQSLLATRLRTHDLSAIAPYYARLLPQLFSVECWGGATFDVAMRFLQGGPVAAARGSSARRCRICCCRCCCARRTRVGYTNYPDNVVRYFVEQAAGGGIDVFRIFDCLNWVDNMRVAIEAVGATGKLCEAAICYTGNLSNPRETKYDLEYYLDIAKRAEARRRARAGHQGHGRAVPAARRRALVKALKDEIGLPVHFHTHDTSGIAAASVLAAIEAGADAVDGAIDSMCGLDLAAEPGLDRRGAALQRRATPGSTPSTCG